MTDLSPLPDSLRALIDAEDATPAAGDPAAIRGRVLATVGITGVALTANASTAAAAGTTTAAAGTTAAVAGVAGKIVAVMLTVGAIGGGAAVVSRDDRPAPRTPAPIVRTVAPAPTVVDHAPVIETLPPPIVVTAPAPARPTPLRKPTASTVDDQRTLLRRAWDARARNEPSASLAAVELDAKLHPDGALAEERDALRIDALVQLSRLDEARDRALAFAARYPDSLHRALISRALEAPP